MGVIIYPCGVPGTLWYLKVIVIKQRWVWVLRSRAAINEMLWADSLPFADVFYSYTVIRPSSPQKVIPNRRWNRDVGNLMNVTPAIQGYFFSNFSFRLSAVHPTAAQRRFGILSHLTGHYPVRDGSAIQRTWCCVRKYVPVNFPRISNENVKYKLVKSPYLLSVSWTAVEKNTKNGGRLVLLPSR